MNEKTVPIWEKYVMTIEEAAARSDVGIETIKAWIDMALVPTIKFNGEIYIPANEFPKKK